MKNWMSILVVGLILSACGYDAVFNPQSLPYRDSFEEKVDVGGYKLNFKYTPGIEPVIVFESGGGNDSSQWQAIQKSLPYSLRNALVSYDRAGHGESEPSTTAYDIETEVAALHSGLEQLGLADDVILVSHSYGGLLANMYAHQYADTTRHILFIDPNNAHFVTMSDAEEAVTWELNHQRGDSSWESAVKRQMLAYVKTIKKSKQILVSPKIKNELSCVVITAGEGWLETEEQNTRWRLSHEEMAENCSTPLVIATGEGHMLPYDAESLVISEIVKIAGKMDSATPFDP